MIKGKAILLNGASSAGKTSISIELQSLLQEPYLKVSIDHFFGMSPNYFFKDDPWLYYTDVPFPQVPSKNLDAKYFDLLMDNFPKIVSGFHKSLGALLEAGNNLIIDHGFHRLSWLDECIKELKEYHVFLIGIYCDQKELERREQERADRPIGMALYQQNIVHRNVLYDYIIDTQGLTAKESAVKILDYINKTNKPSALNELVKKRM